MGRISCPVGAVRPLDEAAVRQWCLRARTGDHGIGIARGRNQCEPVAQPGHETANQWPLHAGLRPVADGEAAAEGHDDRHRHQSSCDPAGIRQRRGFGLGVAALPSRDDLEDSVAARTHDCVQPSPVPDGDLGVARVQAGAAADRSCSRTRGIRCSSSPTSSMLCRIQARPIASGKTKRRIAALHSWQTTGVRNPTVKIER